jgi:flagellar hook protein FlgE
MSIFGSMKTAVSGMNAQANRLSVVSDNIANSNTTGYKAASTSFSSMVLPSSSGNYTSGGITTNVRYSVSNQGDLSYTTSGTDLALQGDGFFVVQNSAGKTYMTRAGDFTKAPNGNLVNSAGYTLMGYPYTSGAPSVVVNGFGGMVPVNVDSFGLSAGASTRGSFKGNLDSSSAIVDTTATPAGVLPSSNAAGATYSSKTSLAAFNGVGDSTLYDFYFTRIPDATSGETKWEVVAYKQSDAATSGTSSFPYSSGPVMTGTMTFDSNGQLSGTTDTGGSPASGTGKFNLIDGTQTIAMDLGQFSQLSTGFGATGTVDGNAPSAVDGVKIGSGGIVYASYADGTSKPLYRIPLATVSSPDNLTLETGNVYSQSATSGVIITGFPGEGAFGSIQSSALEASNVDLAGELTEMIQAQRSYTANSKVFQTGSDLMDVLVNLQR